MEKTPGRRTALTPTSGDDHEQSQRFSRALHRDPHAVVARPAVAGARPGRPRQAWRINFNRSDPALKLANRFKDTGTVIYTAENGGIKQEVFLYWPQTKADYKNVFTDDAREFFFKLDGKNIYPNPQGPNGLGQTVAMWLVDRNTLYRERATKGVVDERVMYRVSPDGNTLVWTNINADANGGHQVWDRIPTPQR